MQNFCQFYVTYRNMVQFDYKLLKLDYFEKSVLELMADPVCTSTYILVLVLQLPYVRVRALVACDRLIEMVLRTFSRFNQVIDVQLCIDTIAIFMVALQKINSRRSLIVCLHFLKHK